MMFKRAYVEITNVCNLHCSFCPGTKRKPMFMTPEIFRIIASKIRPYVDYIYLHVMGEPLLHPNLDEILKIANEYGFFINITTNGTLLKKAENVLISSTGIRKIAISLHSFEGNHGNDLTEYLNSVYEFSKKFSGILSLRLWNEGGENTRNGEIISYFEEKLGVDFNTLPSASGSIKLGENLYLESAEKFDWPSLGAEEQNVTFCYGLSTQFGVLVDGTIVPCCLDSEGNISLGNILIDDFETIISCTRAQNFKKSMAQHSPCEELCRKCGYATRFKK